MLKSEVQGVVLRVRDLRFNPKFPQRFSRNNLFAEALDGVGEERLGPGHRRTRPVDLHLWEGTRFGLWV